MSIVLSGIEKHYGDYHALRGINLEIPQGEFFSLLGPSGCGKTTLLRVIAGFEGIDEGTVMIEGRDMTDLPANQRPTNMVFQSYAIFPHLSVAQNVGYGLRKHGLDRAETTRRVGDALEMVGLDGYGARAAHALSGGQRQRVALARALILRPKVLLLDEPLSALDRKMREQMQVELIKLQRQVGITFVLVTHDQEEALVMSDSIAVMFDGEIGQMDEPERLYRRPISRKVADFIGVMNFIPATVHDAGARIALDMPGFGKATIDAEQAPSGAAPGAATIGIRPESLQVLGADDPVPPYVLDGVVDETVYYGDMTYYHVRVPQVEHPLIISMKNVIGREVLEHGAPCRVGWDPRALVLIRDR